jgi:hypothetical protein
MKEYKFEAIIKESKIGKGGAYIEFPFEVEKEFGIKGRVPVIVYFENIEYKGSLMKMGTSCHMIGILKEIRNKLGKDIGDAVQVRVIKDETERTVEINHKLKAAFEKNDSLRIAYEKLSYTRQKEINILLNSAKTETTLNKRLQKILAELEK